MDDVKRNKSVRQLIDELEARVEAVELKTGISSEATVVSINGSSSGDVGSSGGAGTVIVRKTPSPSETPNVKTTAQKVKKPKPTSTPDYGSPTG
jgi:hypothetical protein